MVSAKESGISDHLDLDAVPLVSRLCSANINPLATTLGGEIALVGYAIHEPVVEPGGRLRLTLFWEALKSPTRDYTAFVHLTGPDGRIWAQRDQQPQLGVAPTRFWAPDQDVRDPYELTLPSDAPSGTYALHVGLYDRDTMRRLPAEGAGGNDPDRVLLGHVEVGRPSP